MTAVIVIYDCGHCFYFINRCMMNVYKARLITMTRLWRNQTMKKIAKVTLIMITVLASLCLPGCGKYVSSWSASAYVHTNTSTYAYMDFWTFKGTQVHTLKCKNETGTLNYSGKLEKGKLYGMSDVFPGMF